MNIQDKMDIIADNPRLIDVKPLHSALQSILDLHAPEPLGELPPLCQACGPVFHPCKTVRAIENTLKEYT